MRTLLALLAAAAACPAVTADPADAARDLVEQAVRAHGGADALAKAQKVSREGKGVMTLFGKEVPITDRVTLALPDRARIDVDVYAGAEKRAQVVLVFDRDRGWQSTGGAVAELPKERAREVAEELYVQWLATLVPLRDKEYTLTPVPDAEVDKRPVRGVKVTRKDRPDVVLYFDKETKLLAKIARQAREGGLVVDKEYVFGDYRAVDGVQLPGKLVESVGGKKFGESAVTYKLLPKVEDATFAKP